MKIGNGYPQVIIVDDEEYILDFMKSELEFNKLEVSSFSSSTKAIEYIERLENKTQNFFVITDYCMPEMSGIDMIEELISKGVVLSYSILLSGLIPKDDLERASKIKGLEVMEKPVDLDQVISFIKTSSVTSEI